MRWRGFTALAGLSLLLLAAPAQAAEKVRLILDWFVNPDHGAIYVALENGYFREAGLDVEIIAPADPNDPPKLVAAGQADLAVSYQPQLHLQVDQKLPVMRVGTLVDTPLNTLTVLRDGPIKSVADLKGKRIGFSVGGGVETALLTAMFAKHGFGMGDVTMINVNWSLSPSLITGRVDGVIGAYRNFELNQMDIAGHPGRAFFVEEEGVPPFDQLIVIAKADKVAGNAAIRPFLDALERGAQFAINHPDEGYALFARGRKDVDNELNRRAWKDTVPRLAKRPAALDQGRYARFASFMQGHGLIKEAPPIESYAVEVR